MSQVVFSARPKSNGKRVLKDPAEKAREVLETYDIRQVAEGVYSVKAPNAQQAYIVDVKNSRCTCKAGQNGQNCKHVNACKMLEEEVRAQEKKAEEQAREELDLLQRFVGAEVDRLVKTLTEEWRVKVLKEIARRILALEKALASLKGEGAEKFLEKLLE